MNKALEELLKSLEGWDPELDNQSLVRVLKRKDGATWHGHGCPSPNGFDYSCMSDAITIGKIDGMPEIDKTRFTWVQFVKWARKQMEETKEEETKMTTSIEPEVSFNLNLGAQAIQLQDIETRIRMHIVTAAQNLLEVGRCLNEAKDRHLVPHGEWENWVKVNTGLPEWKAQRLMKAARETPEGSTMSKLPLSKINAILALPEGDREAMAERAIEEDMTVKQLRDAIAKERKRSDAMIEKYNRATQENRDRVAEVSGLRSQLSNARQEYEERRKALDQEHQREIGALRLQLQEALAAPVGIGPAAQERIDQLTQELADAEAYAEEQARLRQEAQQELLNASMQHDVGGEIERLTFGPENLEAAVRAFMGEVGVMMYMDAELASMNDIAKGSMRRQLAMVEDWLRKVKQQLAVQVIVAE